jgi:hypothetical protein
LAAAKLVTDTSHAAMLTAAQFKQQQQQQQGQQQNMDALANRFRTC